MGYESDPFVMSSLVSAWAVEWLNWDWNHSDILLTFERSLLRVLPLWSWTVMLDLVWEISWFVALNILAQSLYFSTSYALESRTALALCNVSLRISCCSWFLFCLSERRLHHLCMWKWGDVSSSVLWTGQKCLNQIDFDGGMDGKTLVQQFLELLLLKFDGCCRGVLVQIC